MKTLKYILIFILCLGTFNSCLVDDKLKSDANDEGYNVAGFELTNTTVSGIADGSEYIFNMKVKVVGPTKASLTNDITLTVAADPSSTAIEGTHYSIVNPTVTLSASNNYLGYVKVKMITRGIVTPLAKSPVLVLNATNATGDPKVINNGKSLTLTMNFACYTELQGSYTVTINRVSTVGAASTYVRTNEVITKIGVETYRTTYVGHWLPADLAPGTPGFTFSNSCNDLSIGEQNLADYWANIVTGTAIGKLDPVTGDLYLEYSVCASGACNKYKCTYVRN